MPTAAFATLGCKVNQYETQRILNEFESAGFDVMLPSEPADVYVLNSCSVTQSAERKSRSVLRRFAHQNPDAIVVMTGCYGEMAALKGEAVPEAHLWVRNADKLRTLERLLQAYPHLAKPSPADRSVRAPWPASRTRATLKVQDGCDVFCSFCSIPYTRKAPRSRPFGEVVAESESLASAGYREIVVTGVLVGAYGQDRTGSGVTDTPEVVSRPEMASSSGPLLRARTGRGMPLSAATVTAIGEPLPAPGIAPPRRWDSTTHYDRPDLADLLLALASVPGIQRVRLSSIEPTQLTPRLLDAFASCPVLCPHLHLPLQSGDTGVLKAMNRPYNQGDYLDRCREAQGRIPDLAITTDIMVGFPSEDRAAFESTLYVVREIGFARSHVFRYSPRPGTPASELQGQVAEQEKLARSKELMALCRGAQQAFVNRYLNQTLPVLVEGVPEDSDDHGASEHGSVPLRPAESALLGGYTPNYIRVQLVAGRTAVGQVLPVTLLEPSGVGALGEVALSVGDALHCGGGAPCEEPRTSGQMDQLD